MRKRGFIKKWASMVVIGAMLLGLPGGMVNTAYAKDSTDLVQEEETTEPEAEAEPQVEGTGTVSYGPQDTPADFEEGIHRATNSDADEALQEESMTVASGNSDVTLLDASYANLKSSRNDMFYCAATKKLYFINIGENDYSNYADYVLTEFDGSTYTTVYSVKGAEEIYYTNEAFYSITTNVSKKSEPVVIGDETYSYECVFTIRKYNIVTGEESTLELEPMDETSNWSNPVSAFGVDDYNRVYLATNDNKIILYDAKGKKLSQNTFTKSIYQFCGFDKTNGNFYYTGYENWVYWGYNHAMTALMAGNVSADNQIVVKEKNLAMLYQSYFFERKNSICMMNDKYLGVLNTFSGNTLFLLDSNQYDYNDYEEQSTTISLVDSSVSVTPLNIKNTDNIKLAVATSPSVYEDNRDVSSVGTRGVLFGDSLIAKTDTNEITEYNIAGKKKVIAANTSHPVYNLYVDGSSVVVIEKDGDDFYIEKINWQVPTDYTAFVPGSMQIGENAQIICDNQSNFVFEYTYTSSDSSIVSVSKSGELNAWKNGTATITIEDGTNHVKKQFQVIVSGGSKGTGVYAVTQAKGTTSNNIHLPYASGYYGSVTTAYMNQLSNGDYERVEWVNSKVIVETYSSDYTLKNKKSIAPELSIFGGYYKGSDANYLVFGERNKEESDDKEVIRVVKYDTNWNRISACSIKGANTYIPFDAGGLDMTEAAGKLYVHTCHEMYQSSDGYHHQANCTFVVNESSMQLADSYYDVMNISTGYVSHSFNQRICSDGSYVYRVDLGDAYPRGIAYTKTSLNKNIDEPEMYGTIHQIPGSTGQNYTGYNLGGVELSDTNTVVSGSGLNNNISNVWVAVVNNQTGAYSMNWITNYGTNSNVRMMQPKLVKLTGSQFILLWEESESYPAKYKTKYVLLNADGTTASKIYTTPLALSACDPIVNAKGNVCWYATNNTAPIFVEINPYAAEEVQNKSAGDKTFANSTNTSGNGGNTGDSSDDDSSIGQIGSDEGISMSGVAHVQTYGNKNATWNNNTLTLGTTGQGKRLESITIKLENKTGLTGGIQYRVHRQTYGWTSWKSNGTAAGTTGEAKRLEAIQLKLTGELAEKYSIRYRVHIQTYGWKQGWQYDGALAGTTGEAKRLEALEIQIVPKESSMGVTYRVHRQTYGWETDWKKNGAVSGTTGQAKRLEGITIALTGNEYSGSITYSTHVQTYGWMDPVSDGWMSGTSGQAKRLEAIKIRLSGEVADYYDIYYRVHAQSYGWLGWAKNGNPAGTAGYAKRLEAIQIVLVPKGAGAPSNNYNGVKSTNAKAYISKY